MTTALFGDSQAEGLHMPLRELLGDEHVTTLALRGQGTRAIAERVEDDYRLGAFDRIIVVAGGNDSASSRYPETLAFAAGVFRARARQVVWVGPSHVDARIDPETAARHDATRAIQARVLPRLGVTFLDPRSWQVGAAGEHGGDGVHFTRDAYELQAQALVRALEGGIPWGWIALGVATAVGLGYAASQR